MASLLAVDGLDAKEIRGAWRVIDAEREFTTVRDQTEPGTSTSITFPLIGSEVGFLELRPSAQA